MGPRYDCSRDCFGKGSPRRKRVCSIVGLLLGFGKNPAVRLYTYSLPSFLQLTIKFFIRMSFQNGVSSFAQPPLWFSIISRPNYQSCSHSLPWWLTLLSAISPMSLMSLFHLTSIALWEELQNDENHKELIPPLLGLGCLSTIVKGTKSGCLSFFEALFHGCIFLYWISSQ